MFFPRNQKSTQSIAMPKSFDKEISDLFSSEFKEHLKLNQSLDFKSCLYENELICSLNLSTKNQLKAQVFEASMDYKALSDADFAKKDLKQAELAQHSKDIQKLVHLAIDYLAICLDTFLTETKTPSDKWTKINFQKQILFIRCQNSNLALEEQADKLLGKEFLDNLTNTNS